MLNNIRVDFQRMFLSKIVLFTFLVAAVFIPVGFETIMVVLDNAMNMDTAVSLTDFANYSSMAPFVLAVLITVYLHGEAGEGIVRNKIISGKKRYQIVLSYCIVAAVLAAVIQIVSVLATPIVPLIAGKAFEVTFSEVIRFTWVSTLAEVALCVIYTSLFLCFCTKEIAAGIPAALAILAKIVLIVVIDALYTSSGVAKVSGFTFKAYVAIDRYVPFSHLSGDLRWDDASYIKGNLAAIAIFAILGIVVINKKDLK